MHTGLDEMGCGHVLEFLKIVKQTQPGSYWHLTTEITKSKGIFGLWDGFVPWGLVQAAAKGAVFGWGHATARQQLQPYVENNFISANASEVIAGGIGGTYILRVKIMCVLTFQ